MDRLDNIPVAAPVTASVGYLETTFAIKGKIYTSVEMTKLSETCCGNREKMAECLAISRTTLWKYLKRMGIN